MKPVEQTIATPPKGDCFRACVASILELPIEECPNPPSDPDGHWWVEWIDWLRPRGFELIHWEVPGDKREGSQRICGALAGYWIATVQSLNCPPNPERPNLGRHCIVMKGQEIAHDPSTGQKRTNEDWEPSDRIFEVTLLHPLDPVPQPSSNEERLSELAQELRGEIERCRELGRIWAEEGIDAEFPANPEDRAWFFEGQADRLQAALDAALREETP